MAATDSVSTIDPGTPVRFTADSLGLIERDGNALGFAEPIVGNGDEGTYVEQHPNLDDWHMIGVEVDGTAYLCPCHLSQFEVIS